MRFNRGGTGDTRINIKRAKQSLDPSLGVLDQLQTSSNIVELIAGHATSMWGCGSASTFGRFLVVTLILWLNNTLGEKVKTP